MGKRKDKKKKKKKIQWKAVGVHVALVVVLAFYTLLGTIVFRAIEAPHELMVREAGLQQLKVTKEEVLDSLWLLASNESLDFDAFERLASAGPLDQWSAAFGDAYGDGYVRAGLSNDSMVWSVSGAVLFAVTTLTTIGYGTPAPVTPMGRLLCVGFGLMGIPLMIVTLADMAKFLGAFLSSRYEAARKSYLRWQGVSRRRVDMALFDLPVSAVFSMLILYPVFAASLVQHFEGWSYMDSFYFCFISVFTIGFGDFSPSPTTAQYVFTLSFMILGLIVTTMCVDMVGGAYITKIHFLGRKLGEARALLAALGGRWRHGGNELIRMQDTSGESLNTARSEPTTTVPERGQTGPLQLPVADYAPCPVTPDSDHGVDELEQQQAHDGDNAKEDNAECLLAADVVAAVSSEQSVVSDAVDDVQTVQDEPTIDAMVSESRQSVNEPLPSEPSWASCDQAPAVSAPAVDDLPDDFDAHQLLEAELDRSVDCTAGRPTRPGRGSRRRQFKAAKRARVRVRQGQGAKPVQDDNASPDSKRRRLMRLNKTEYFEVLPDGWKEMEHASGLPIFYHAATCVCTFSRPYFLGGASARHHTVPISAIPCLQQRRARERADEDHEQQMQLQQHDVGAAKNDVIADFHEKFGAPAVKVQTAADYRRCTLVPRELRTYCAERFELNVKGPQKAACDRAVELNGEGCDQNEAGAADVEVDDAITTEASCSGTNDATNGVTSMCANVEAEAVAEKSLPDRPAMPSNLQLITVHTSAPAGNERKFRHGRNFCLNPQGKTSVAVLHEFVQKVFRVQIRYEYEETRNPAAPYKARVMLANKSNHGANGYKQPKTQQDIKQIVSKLRERAPNASGSPIKLEPGVESAEDQWTTVGQGTGASKNKAKLEAARNALSVLVPGVQFGADGIATGAAPPPASQATNGAGGASIGNEVPSSAAPTVKAEIGGEAETLALFDLLPVCDGRVSEMSVKLGQPSPFVVLQECLKRNATFGDTTIETRVEHLGHQRHNFHMTVGKHNVSAECKNKLTGKQAAAQAMLQKLHPLLTSWGALLRLYGYDATQKLKETKKKKDEVIQLQTSGTNSRGPNQAILDKLRLEMDRLYKSMTAAPPAPPSPSKRAHAFADV